MASAKLKLPPGPRGSRLFGNTFEIFKDPYAYSRDVSEQYPGLTRIRIMGKNAFIVSDPEAVRQIFLTETENFRKGPFYQRLRLIAGVGLITSEGPYWQRQRRLAQPAFHKEKLQGFMDVFTSCAQDVAARWDKLKPDTVIHMQEEMGALSLRIVGKTLFSIDMEKEASDIPVDVKKILRFLNKRNYAFPRMPMWMPLPSHRAYFKYKARLDTLIYRIIDERLAGHTKGEDLLSMFVESTDAETGEKMTREQLRDEIMTIFLAGFETVSVALMWTWYLLSKNPGVTEKLLEEHERVLGDKTPTTADIPRLEYTMQVINESMRLYPSVFTIPRQAAADVKMLGYDIPKDSFILISILALHHSEKYWEAPKEFRPERFAKANTDKFNKLAYIPFGTGQRMCIGNNFALMEMAAVLAILARRFEARTVENYTPKPLAAITANATEGMTMHIRRRQKL